MVALPNARRVRAGDRAYSPFDGRRAERDICERDECRDRQNFEKTNQGSLDGEHQSSLMLWWIPSRELSSSIMTSSFVFGPTVHCGFSGEWSPD